MKTVFRTERLNIRPIGKNDYLNFSRLLSDIAVVSAIPQSPFTEVEINEKFNKAISSVINIAKNKVTILGVYLSDEIELVGLCAFLTNDEGNKELGYRFLEEYWGKGYATELTREAIDFCFNNLQIDKLTADVAIKNLASAKVLGKFFKPVKEFYNEADSCFDRRYELNRRDWKV
jgi:RimJ/RimL family protein N-acetyltransferase